MVWSESSQRAQEVSASAYRAMFTRSRDMCIALERGSGRIMRCNDAVGVMLGFSHNDIVGRPITSLARQDTPSQARRVWQSLAANLKVSASDVQVQRKDGGWIDACLTGAGVRDAAGKVSFGVALLRMRPKALPQADSPTHSVEHLRILLRTLSVAEERERRRIAAGLHDELGQLLAIAKLRLGRLGAATGAVERETLTNDLRDLIDQAATAARSTTFELNCPVLQQLGLNAAIRNSGERMQALYGFHFRLNSDDAPVDLPHETLMVLLRVVREALFNVHKHAHASAVHVTSWQTGERLIICVNDNGVGYQPAAGPFACTPQGGFGLLSAEAQIHAIGGHFSIESAPGAGTSVTISVPMPKPAVLR